MWKQFDETWKDASVPITATASTAFLARGLGNAGKSTKGMYMGQYAFGWNAPRAEWITGFTAPEANAFHNSLGIEASIAHEMTLKVPGNTYNTKVSGVGTIHIYEEKNDRTTHQSPPSNYNPHRHPTTPTRSSLSVTPTRPQAKHGIEVFHIYNGLAGAKEFAGFFNASNPLFKDDKRYAGPLDSIIWKVEDDINFQA